MRFQSSNYGSDAAAIASEIAGTPVEAATSDADYYAQYAPFLRSFILGADIREKTAQLEGKIQNYRKLAEKSKPGPVRNYYVMELNKLTKQLEALKSQSRELEYAAKTTNLARTALAVGAFVGVGILGLYGYNMWQRAKLTRQEIKLLESRG
jgi:hypothetical protein